MHELSIAHSLVEIAEAAARRVSARRVDSVNVVVGALSGVELGALTFCYDIATQGTLLAGSKLVTRAVPVVVYCPRCEAEGELADVRSFRCPRCGELTGDLRSGRELYVESLEAETTESEASS